MTEKALSSWEQAIDRLLELTQDEEIQWTIAKPEKYTEGLNVSGAVFVTTVSGQTLVLYRRAHEVVDTSTYRALFPSLLFSPSDSKIVYRAELALFDDETNTISYEFPRSVTTEELYTAASYNASNVQSFIDSLIGQKSMSLE